MTKMTKFVLGALFALLLVTATSAVAQTNTVKDQGLYQSRELGLSLGTGYSFGPAGQVSQTLFTKQYDLNFNAGVFYFPWRNLGFEANVPFYQTKGVCVDEVQAGLLLRLPLAKTTPLFRNIAPYVGVGGVYNWQTAQNWAYVGKVGTEFRLTSKWGIFVEGQYRNSDFTMKQGNVSLNGGLRLIL